MWYIPPLLFGLTYFSTLILERWLKGKGMVVPDAHKKGRPKVPMPGGPSIALGLCILSLSTIFTGDIRGVGLLILALSGFLIGLYDDLKKLGGRQKVLLLLLPGLLLALSGVYEPRPYLPFIGAVRLTILYPLLLILASTIMANGVNMLDIFNGLVSSALAIATIPLLIFFLVEGDMSMVFMALGYMAVLLGFYLRHRYPSKIFPGDSGSMAMGLAYMALMVEGRAEVLGIVALLPMVLNGFFILSSLGGFVEHEDIKERPTRTIIYEGLPFIAANRNPEAPLTLTRFLVWGGPMRENEIVKNILLLFLASCLLSVLTLFMGGFP